MARESKEIPLTKGKVAIVDCDLFESLNAHKWHFCKGYAMRNGPNLGTYQSKILMHRVVCNTPEGVQTDHINLNKLDNRQANLRLATGHQNRCNTEVQKSNRLGVKGVRFHKGRFEARITVARKSLFLGNFSTCLDAALAYAIASQKLHGEFGRTA